MPTSNGIYPILYMYLIYTRTHACMHAHTHIWFECLRPYYDSWRLMDFTVAYRAQNEGSKDNTFNLGESVLPKDIVGRKWPTPRASNLVPPGLKASVSTNQSPALHTRSSYVRLTFRIRFTYDGGTLTYIIHTSVYVQLKNTSHHIRWHMLCVRYSYADGTAGLHYSNGH